MLGDLAGDGLYLAIAQMLHDRNSPNKPEKTVLLSSRIDLSMSNPEINELDQQDLLLSAETLKILVVGMLM